MSLKTPVVAQILLIFLIGCAALPKDVQRPRSEALPPDPQTRLGKGIEPALAYNPGHSAFYPLASGQEALIARIASAAVADHSLDLQYYIWHNDMTGRILMHKMLQAADRGVRVRALLDDLNIGQYQRGLRILDYHPNIEIRMANPFASRHSKIFDAMRFKTLNRRMHNKVFIADNQTAIFGGRNIGDEYFSASGEMNFGDFDLWAIGPVVKDLSKEFDSYWNSDIAYPISSLVTDFKPTQKDLDDLRNQAEAAIKSAETSEYAEALKDTALARQFTKQPLKLYWGDAQVVIDPPEKFKQKDKEEIKNLTHQLRPLIQETRKEVILVSPYFIPGEKGVEFFSGLAKRGVKSVVLTNSLASSDVATVFSGYKPYRKDLLQVGVGLYEFKPNLDNSELKKKAKLGSSFSSAGLHGKIFVFDRKKVYVGSMNLDPRSFDLNSEMGVVVTSPELAQDIANTLLKSLSQNSYEVSLDENKDLRWKTLNSGHEVIYKKEPETSWWKRFKANMSGFFVPESWL
ncbi:phospholipase D family protein [Bdellovibrio sp. HCB337]|uniref:phospholipase D family protein n=1 Tax=Bdellovibrio sp. HCB337 TaxID=3394358 RepID=UPI0039A78667